jgi:hypothetical protein
MFLAAIASVALAAPGDHLPVGSSLLAPRLGLGVDVSNNALRSEAPADGAGAANMHIAVGATLKHDYRDFLWNVGGTYDVRKFVTENDARLDRFDEFSLQASGEALRLRALGLAGEASLANRFTPVDTEAPGRPYTTQFATNTRLGLVVRPGSALDVTLAGFATVDDYNTASSPVVDSRDFNRRYAYGPSLDVNWNFLPRTTAIVQVSSTSATWTAPALFVAGVDPIGFADSTSLRAIAGVRGRVTERLTIDARLGYADADFDETTTDVGGDAIAVDVSGAEKVVGKLVGSYQTGVKDALTLGYERDFRASYFTNFVSFDRVTIGARRQIAPAVSGSLDASIASERFRGQQTRDDIASNAKASAQLSLNKWATIEIAPGWYLRSSTDSQVEFSEFRGSVTVAATY